MAGRQEGIEPEKSSSRSDLWVSQPVKSPPRSWDNLLFGAGAVILFAVAVILLRFLPANESPYAHVPSPSGKVDQPAALQSTATLRSLPPTWTPEGGAGPTGTLPFRTATPYLSPTPTLTPTIDDRNYPEVDPESFYAGPAPYAGRRLRLSARIITFGEAGQDGELFFAVQVDPTGGDAADLSAHSPILILGLEPDARLAVNLAIRVWGKGAQPEIQVEVNGIPWTGPVILGEKWEMIP